MRTHWMPPPSDSRTHCRSLPAAFSAGMPFIPATGKAGQETHTAPAPTHHGGKTRHRGARWSALADTCHTGNPQAPHRGALVAVLVVLLPSTWEGSVGDSGPGSQHPSGRPGPALEATCGGRGMSHIEDPSPLLPPPLLLLCLSKKYRNILKGKETEEQRAERLGWRGEGPAPVSHLKHREATAGRSWLE